MHEHLLKGEAIPCGKNAMPDLEHILLNCKKFEDSQKTQKQKINETRF